MIIVPLYHRNIKSLSTRKPSRTRPARSNLAQMLGLVRNDFGKNKKSQVKTKTRGLCSITISLKPQIFISTGQFDFSLWLYLK